MTRLLTALLLSSALAACSPSEPEAQAPTPDAQTTSVETAPAPQSVILQPLWQLDGFEAPESVIEADDGTTLYVSNVGGDGSAQDNNGVISKIGMDGAMINRNWVAGTEALPLHGPKGMALVNGTLVVTDIDHVVLIDTEASNIIKRIPAEGAGFLNDAVAGPDGTALISDSANARIYSVQDDVATIWLEDERLGGVNGLHNDGDRLLVTTMDGGELLSVDWDTKAITGLASGMENADGIGLRSDGSYIISSWPGQLWHVQDGEAPTLLQDTSGDTPILMNDILLSGDTLVTPNWMPGTVRGYGVE
ncbi:hypothetical protein GCM10007853_19490 [Algimonas ampicilliniresistens]|uniref:ATP/GTP-binding protein n=1 Tax=Algimonas ampicilliniresistens TaxID=1298735 RepID=A0ABQ5V9G0_9PROT|nr:hypothetical protein [Algimonas ampicilliniresistens]GLQ24075.1 hypothetical protein GCM10007853_19490 [Algimonas ampicilliniresistens]